MMINRASSSAVLFYARKYDTLNHTMPHYIADIHAHSKYSRAVSKQMTLKIMAQWADTKGIDIISPCDFTHPAWFAELEKKLVPAEPGLYRLRGIKHNCRFLLSTEVSCIYKRGDKARRVHHLILMPDLASVNKFNTTLDKNFNLKSDGRPILGLDSEELVKYAHDAAAGAMLIPAHIWTPWFAMFGSQSGFDTIEECFGSMTKHVHAIETGLSSDPPMNWRISQLDPLAIVSFSDAHSPAKLGREATVFDMPELAYDNFIKALKNTASPKNKITSTIEFYPEEGRYHYDGHRKCEVRLTPQQTKRHKGICPSCKKKVTVGVSYRVNALADRPEGYTPPNRPPFKSLVPLQEIIAEALQKGVATKTVQSEYEAITDQASEFDVLLSMPIEQVKAITQPKIAEGIRRVRDGELHIEPGYDGEYGIVQVFTDAEKKLMASGQSSLF